MRFFVLAGLIIVVSAVPGTAAENRAEHDAAKVKLGVIISIDQLRADYLVRFRPYFGEGGFKRMLEEGTDFRNCHFRHALTQTAPGHATISTGAHANVNGITSNEWIDLESWEIVNNVEDRGMPLVGPVAGQSPPPLLLPKAGRSPHKLLAETVGDRLKERFGADSKVFAVSNKDRSAILLGGRKADAAYWDEAGQMVTSRYYRDALPAWVAAFNAERLPDTYFGKTWERLLPAEIYEKVQGPDDVPGESDEVGFARTLPKKIDGGGPAISGRYYAAFDRSPFASEVLGMFAERALREEQLGRHAAPDLLCVSFSQLDEIGHAYGPDSHEVMDTVLRLDRILARLFAAIDREVGLQHCVVVLSSDHGAAPMPERLKLTQPDVPAGRVNYGAADQAVRGALIAAFGALPEGEYWFVRYNNGYHLRPSALAARKADLEDAARVVKKVLEQVPFIAEVYTRGEILAAPPEGDSVLAMVRRSYYAPRDRDVVFVTHPNYFTRSLGTTHGTPYDYDTHVPQVWFGAGVPRSVRPERVGVDDIAPTMAALLGISAPAQSEGRRLF